MEADLGVRTQQGIIAALEEISLSTNNAFSCIVEFVLSCSVDRCNGEPLYCQFFLAGIYFERIDDPQRDGPGRGH